MKNKTIYLEAEQKKDCLTIGIREKREPELPISSCEDRTVHREKMIRVENHCRETIEILNRKGRKAGECSERLKETGVFLCDELLTHDIKQELTNTDAEYLILKIDNHLVHIPWELIYLDGQYLCERFNIGRLVKTRQKITEPRSESPKGPLKMWILANPVGDLDSAASEGSQLVEDMDSVNPDGNPDVIEADLDSEITAEKIKTKIRDYDFVHFAGHFHYDTEDPGRSGWKLAHGNLTARDVDNMTGSGHMPVLVFSNACQSARTEEWTKDAHDSLGMANAFLCAGVQYYVGSFWEIMDIPGSLFSREFYKHLVSGKTIGQAVRLAREMLKKHYPSDFAGWASYILYGDPGFRCFRCNGENTGQENYQPEKYEKTVSPVRGEHEHTPWNKKQDGNQTGRHDRTETKKMGKPALFLVIIILAFCSILLLADKVSEHVTRQAFYEDAIKKQNEINELNEKIAELFNFPPNTQNSPENDPLMADNWTSGHLTIIVDIDTFRSDLSLGKENMLLSHIHSQIIDSTDFTPLERERFVIILREIYQELTLKPPEKRKRPELAIPQYFLFITVRKSWIGSAVFVRLADKKGRVFSAWDETLQNCSEKLLKTLEELQKKYPVRGLISEIKDREIILNIGRSSGVRAGQQFKVVGKDAVLEISSFGENTSTAMIIKHGKVSLEKGMKVER
ncbi:MAG: CHAT domain-containing protein [Desulfobacteraceae bacterium]|nr:CHAT domain-containing protein [Desulfobacteraceae bacterium]